MKKAIITIEVLISLLILFLIIATSSTTLKVFQSVLIKKDIYEKEYITVLSIKDKISHEICTKKSQLEGRYNGFDYKANCRKLKESRTFKKAFEGDEKNGAFGNYIMRLNSIKLELKKGSYSSEYNYIKTTNEKVL